MAQKWKLLRVFQVIIAVLILIQLGDFCLNCFGYLFFNGALGLENPANLFYIKSIPLLLVSLIILVLAQNQTSFSKKLILVLIFYTIHIFSTLYIVITYYNYYDTQMTLQHIRADFGIHLIVDIIILTMLLYMISTSRKLLKVTNLAHRDY